MFKIHAGNYILTTLMHSHRMILKALGEASFDFPEEFTGVGVESESESSATNLEARGKQTNHHTQAVATPSLAHHCGMNAAPAWRVESGKQYLLQAAGSGGAKLGFRLGEDGMR